MISWIDIEKDKPKQSGKYLVAGRYRQDEPMKYWVTDFLILSDVIGGFCEPARNPPIKAWLPILIDFSKNPKEEM